MSPAQPNPYTCTWGTWFGVPGSSFPLMQQGSTGSAVGYLAAVMRCKQGLWLPWANLNPPFEYSWLCTQHVIQFQTWWNYYGAGLTVDGKAGPATMPYYRMLAGHTPW